MATHQAWYPLSRVLSPPELPIYLKNVHELKPIIGVPSDSELIGIHTVIRAASRASDIPGMHDANLNMNLADHLFDAQMARYRSKYSLITFPSDARYTPPALPAHLTGNLEPVHGAPSDDEIIKVQDVLQTYQEFRRIPSMYDARVNMELSQHLFDLHMARHMRHAGESSSSHVPPTTSAPENYARVEERTLPPVEETIGATNNAGTGSDTIGTLQTSAPTLNVDIREGMERSNQLFERFNQLLEQSTQPAQKANELAERSNEFANRANQLAERLNQSHERSNQLLEQTIKTWEQLGGTLGNINRMLMRIQHAIIRVSDTDASREHYY
ncbi:unnamed protein product [Rhizoctonia solani]|uniref:Laminin domain protein n=1 Tax=Rhizoctonia solani TaxID=456999 RepID=A0A8H2XY58_9AGAM|nr:unnamed protein product [Rhizoctonia solani]